MVKSCCVPYCKKEYCPGTGISFHNIPKDEKRREKWLAVLPVNVTNTSVVCSSHFKPEDFINGVDQCVLKKNSVPSVFPFLVEENEDNVLPQMTIINVNDTYQTEENIQLISMFSKQDIIKDIAQRVYESEIEKKRLDEQQANIPISYNIEKSNGPQPKISNDLFENNFSRSHRFKNEIVQTKEYTTSREIKLKRKVKILSQQLKRSNMKINKLERILTIIKNKCSEL